jgi:adenylate cyclase
MMVGIQTPLALFVGVWLHHRDSAREREVIKRAFSYFLPSAVVEQLAQKLGPVTGGNKVVFGACLATDVENYTTLAEHMEPGRLGELMNAYYSELFVPVERSQGVVVDVVGDAMVAVWAKASSPVDVGTRACSAALAIVDALERFNAAPAGRPLLTTRLGLHTGDMLVGSIGGSGHYEYRAVGDVINTSSRIQALNKVLGTRLLASQETVADLPAFATRALGTYLLAGKTRPVSIVELLGVEAEQSTAPCARPSPRPSPVITIGNGRTPQRASRRFSPRRPATGRRASSRGAAPNFWRRRRAKTGHPRSSST